MSDYVTSLIVITGPESSLRSFAEQHLAGQSFDFNSVVKMPPGLDVESGSSVETGYAALYGDWKSVAGFWMFKEPAGTFGFPFPLESREQVLTSLRSFDCADMYLVPAARYHHNIQQYGHGDWTGWCEQYWGTQRNADEVTVREEPAQVTIKFATPSKYPKPVLNTLSKTFVDLKFHVRYFDEHLRWARDFVLAMGRETQKRKRPPSEIANEIREER